MYWPSEFIALKFGVLSAELYDLGSRTMPGIEIEQYGILENFGSEWEYLQNAQTAIAFERLALSKSNKML